MSNNSIVYSCLLDASKAFDKVHYGKLFHMLLNRKVLFCIIRLIINGWLCKTKSQGYVEFSRVRLFFYL